MTDRNAAAYAVLLLTDDGPKLDALAAPRPEPWTITRGTDYRFTFEMADPKHLGHVLGVVRGVEGVVDAYRVTSGKHE